METKHTEMKNRLLNISLVLVVLASCQKEAKKFEVIQMVLSSAPKEVEIFANGIISTGLNERDIAISSDGREIYYTLGNYDNSQRAIVKIAKEANAWLDPQIVSFSGKYNDIEPFLSPDGSKLFFASNRPPNNDTTRSDYNIWYVTKDTSGWANPTALPEIINTSSDEFFPSVSSNGNLYFTATRDVGAGKEDIFLSRYINNMYTEPEPLDTLVNSKTYEFNAFISPDEEMLVFSSYGRADDIGGGDLYFSRKDSSGKWIQAINLGKEINSNRLDYCPFVDFTNNILYFSSNRREPIKIDDYNIFKGHLTDSKNGMGDIYHVSLDKLYLK